MSAEPDWNAYAACYDRMCESNPAYADLVAALRTLAREVGFGRAPGAPPLRVLEIGAGTGNFAAAWREDRPEDLLTLVEPCPEMAAAARRKLPASEQVKHLEIPVGEADFPPASFDLLICVHALYCLPEPEAALVRMRRWLRPGGGFFLCDLGRVLRPLGWRLYFLRHALRRLGPLGAASLFRDYGPPVAAANRQIIALQKSGDYWLHTTAQFAESLHRAGFETMETRRVYRGFSDLAARPPAKEGEGGDDAPAPLIDARAPAKIDRAALRNLLPADAFRPQPSRLVPMALHAALVAGAFWAMGRSSPWLWPLLVAAAAHSLLCLGLLSHDLTHGSILPRSGWRRSLERVFWAMNLISATVWRKVHNETHHHHHQTVRDPDRQFVESERHWFSRAYTRLFYPNRESPVGNPLVWLQLFGYTARNLLAALAPRLRRRWIVPAAPAYSARERLAAAGEAALAAAFLAGLYFLSGLPPLWFAALAFVVYAITSGLSMAYIFTNHALNPVTAEPDLLGGTTSVAVPRWLDPWHSWFSYHTEHHLFPTLRPKHYPLVSRWLRDRHPQAHQRIPIAEAWRRLWVNRTFEPDP